MFTASVQKCNSFLWFDFISSKFAEFILLVLTVFFLCVVFKGFQHIRACHLQTEIFLVLPSQFRFFFSLSNCSGQNFPQHVEQKYRSGGSRHHCLISDLRRKASSSSSLSVPLAVGFSYDLSHAAEVSFLVYIIFLKKGFWTLSVASSASIETMMWFFPSFY